MEEVLPFIKPVGYLSKAIEIKRLRNAKGESEEIKIISEGELPSKVSLNNLTYVLRKFEFNPKCCFRYLLYGHSSDSFSKKNIWALCEKK